MSARLPVERDRRLDRLVALAIFLAVSLTTCAFSRQQGVHRDEAVYMEAGERYIAYWERLLRGQAKAPFAARTVDPYFSCGGACNSEHPPLMKTLFGLSWRLLARVEPGSEALRPGGFTRPSGAQRGLPVVDEITAFRLPTFLLFGALAAAVYGFFVAAFARRGDDGRVSTAGRAAALAAALLTACQPRAFFHAQTAAFDLPAAFFWCACTFAYWRALAADHPRRAGLVVGLLYGLFLATKLQSFFLPIALGAHWAYLAARTLYRRRHGERTAALPSLWPLVGMATVAPLVLVALWPYLWHDTVRHLSTYLAFHANHVHYNFEYFGTNYNHPPFPWHEPLGMLVTTAPVVLLALAAAGAHLLGRAALRDLRDWRARRAAPPTLPSEAYGPPGERVPPGDPRATKALVLVAGVVPIAPFFLGTTPIFGETKHWLATMPMLAIVAGVAVQAILVGLTDELRLARRAPHAAVAALVVALAVAPALAETLHSQPYNLSHYNALAGGPPGGADLGMNRQFWGYAVRGLLPWFNRVLPEGAKIYPHDWSHSTFVIDQRVGLLRRDLRDAGMELPAMRASDAAIVIHELHFNKYDYMIWNTYGHGQPSMVLTLDGVPLVSVYQRQPPDPLAP